MYHQDSVVQYLIEMRKNLMLVIKSNYYEFILYEGKLNLDIYFFVLCFLKPKLNLEFRLFYLYIIKYVKNVSAKMFVSELVGQTHFWVDSFHT